MSLSVTKKKSGSWCVSQVWGGICGKWQLRFRQQEVVREISGGSSQTCQSFSNTWDDQSSTCTHCPVSRATTHPKIQGSLLAIRTKIKKQWRLDVLLKQIRLFVHVECSSFVHSVLFHVRISSLTHSRKTMRNARLASQRDDVHLCIMCLRAIMNYQVCRSEEHIQTQDTATRKIILEELNVIHLFF